MTVAATVPGLIHPSRRSRRTLSLLTTRRSQAGTSYDGTCNVAVAMRSPPDPPSAKTGAPPCSTIVGEKEEAEGLVSVRAQGEGDKGQMTLEAFRDYMTDLVSHEIDANKMEQKN